MPERDGWAGVQHRPVPRSGGAAEADAEHVGSGARERLGGGAAESRADLPVLRLGVDPLARRAGLRSLWGRAGVGVPVRGSVRLATPAPGPCCAVSRPRRPVLRRRRPRCGPRAAGRPTGAARCVRPPANASTSPARTSGSARFRMRGDAGHGRLRGRSGPGIRRGGATVVQPPPPSVAARCGLRGRAMRRIRRRSAAPRR